MSLSSNLTSIIRWSFFSVCATTRFTPRHHHRMVVCFSILAFVYQYDFPPFTVLVIALLNDGTIMTLSVDRVLPSTTPDLAEIFAYAVAYGLYLIASTIAFLIILLETEFFEDEFGVSLSNGVALISHGFFMKRPFYALLVAFCVVSSIIAAFGNWPFTQITGISSGWIGIVWIWILIFSLLLSDVKFAMKANIIKYFRQRHDQQLQRKVKSQSQVPIARTTSRVGSIHENLYGNRVSFIRRTARSVGFKGGMKVQTIQGERALHPSSRSRYCQ